MGVFEVSLYQPGIINPSTGKAVTYELYEVGSGDNDYILNATLKLEANKAGTFEFDILPFHSYYSVLRRYIHYVCVKEDDDILFYGRILNMNLAFNGTKHVTCEGLMANLLDCPMYDPNASTVDKIFTISGSPGSMFSKAIKAYRNRIRTDIQAGNVPSGMFDYDLEEIDVSGGTSVGDFVLSELIEGVGGFVRIEYAEQNDKSITGILHWDDDPVLSSDLSSYATTTVNQTITFGNNMLDLSGESSDDDILTGIVPSWEDGNNDKHWITTRTTDVDSNNSQIYVPYVVGAQSGLGAVGITVVELPGTGSQEKALAYATNYVNKYCSNYILSSGINIDFDSFTVRALDMHYTESSSAQKIWLYDRVRIKCTPHSINRVLMCSSLEILIDNPINSGYTFSIYRPKASSNDKVLTRQIKRKGF